MSIMWLGYLHKVTRESEFSVTFNSGKCEYACLSIFEGVTELELFYAEVEYATQLHSPFYTTVLAR